MYVVSCSAMCWYVTLCNVILCVYLCMYACMYVCGTPTPRNLLNVTVSRYLQCCVDLSQEVAGTWPYISWKMQGAWDGTKFKCAMNVLQNGAAGEGSLTWALFRRFKVFKGWIHRTVFECF